MQIKNVLSLFDGMSCGQLALRKVGIYYEKYYASEIEKQPISITMDNFPDTIQIGNVLNVKGEDLPEIDLLIAGSPCQGFSQSGNGLNFEHHGSKLYFEFLRLLKKQNQNTFF
jgi:site-specific DNA-cytosine methylase